MPTLSLRNRFTSNASVSLFMFIVVAAACMLPASSVLAAQAEADALSQEGVCYNTFLAPFDISISLEGDSSGAGDTILVTLAVTPVQTYPNVRLWLNVDSGGVTLVDPPDAVYDSLPAYVEQTFQAAVELSSTGRTVIQGGVEFIDEVDSTQSILSEEIYLIVEPDRTSWSAADFLIAEIDSLDYQLSSGQISQAEYDAAFLELRTLPATTTIEIDSSGSSLRSSNSNSDFVVINVDITWKDRNGTQHPFRYATVELVEEKSGGDVVLATGVTDGNGRTNFALEPIQAFGSTLYVNIWYRSEGFYVAPVGTRNDSETANNATYRSKPPSVQVQNVLRTYNILAVVEKKFAKKAASVHQALVMSSRYVEDKSGTILSTIPVEFPGSRSFLSINKDFLHLDVHDGYDWDVIQHEYGHYVQWAFGFGNNPGGRHGLEQNMAETRGKQDGLRIAWGEGWPTYFALTAQFESSGAEGVPDIRDVNFNETEEVNKHYSIDFSFGDQYVAKGEDNELSVQRILWDLYDEDRELHDRIALGDDNIWVKMVLGQGVTTLSEFWNALIKNEPLEVQTEFGRIFAEYNVAPDPIEPPDFFEIQDLSSVPTFKWEENGGGPTHRLNEFILEFWDDDLQTLLLRIRDLNTNEYTPTTTELQLIFTDRSTCKWLVRGRNTDAPATGWYMSPARLLVYEATIAFVIDNTGSMQQEIDGVRDALLRILADYPPDSPDKFQLTTFKDAVIELAPTDLATVTSQVEDLTASFGDDCPEASVQALLQVADGADRIFIATDASPRSGSSVEAAVQELRNRTGKRVDIISTGGCGGSVMPPGYTGFSTISTNAPLMDVSGKSSPVDRGYVALSSQSLTPLALGDNDFVEVALPFPFPFAGQDWNSVHVSADGYITFGGAIADPYPDRVFLQLGPPRIAGFWSNLNPGLGGQISAGEVDGEFHVVYDQVPFESYPDSVVSATIILKTDGSFFLDLGPAQVPFDYGILCGAAPGYLESLGPDAHRDLSTEPEPILPDEFGTAYESTLLGFSGGYDLAGERLVFAPVTYTPPPPPVEYTAFEAYTALARETGGIYVYQPEVNYGDSADKQRFENTIFNIIQGGLTNSVALVSPFEGPAGDTVVISLTGSSTNFQSNTQVSFSGAGITVVDVAVVSPIELTATIFIDGAATPGFRDVTAQTDLTGGEIETAVGEGAFEVVPALPGPEIISVSPIAAQAGQDVVLTVYGGGASPFVDFTDATAVDFGDGITVNSFQALGPKTLEASVSVDSAAVAGPRDVVITSPFYVFEEFVTGPFFVTFPFSLDVQLTGISPQSASPGTNFSISITGANTAFQDGITTVSLGDTSISVTDVTVTDPEHLTAQVQLDPTVVPGFRDVRVETVDESVALLDAFLIIQHPCGNLDGSEGINIVDISYLVDYLFLGGNAPLDSSAGDINCSGTTNVTDLSLLVDYVFFAGAAPCATCPQ